MEAAVFGAPRDIHLDERPRPEPGPGEALVEVRAAGVCAGDLYIYLGSNPYVTYPRIGGHEIAVPPMSEQVDYEVEFTAVIGKRLSRAKESDVMPALFGYTLLNDVSARDVQFKDNQITLGKNFDRFAPIGPWIVTTDELTAPGAVRLTTRLNGATMQDGNTSEWLFPPPRLISFLSQVMALEPGDLVNTGTPASVGVLRNHIVA